MRDESGTARDGDGRFFCAHSVRLLAAFVRHAASATRQNLATKINRTAAVSQSSLLLVQTPVVVHHPVVDDAGPEQPIAVRMIDSCKHLRPRIPTA